MTYQELSRLLSALSDELEKHHTKLSGEAPAKIAKTLASNSAKLQKMLTSAVAEGSSGMIRLRGLLDAQASKLTIASLQSLAKKAGIQLPGGAKATPASTRTKLLALALENGLLEEVDSLLEAYISILNEPTPDFSGEEKLRAELRSLGARSPTEIEMKIEAHYSDSELHSLAKAAGLKVSPKTSRKALLLKVIHYARRNFQNTAMNM